MHCFLEQPIDLAVCTLVAGQPNPLRSMGANFRGKRAEFGAGDVATGLTLLAALVAGVWLLSRFLSQQERRQPYNRPGKLFAQLCAAHGLDRRSRSLLKQLARHQQLAQPAMLFIEAERFDPHRYGSALASESARLAALKDKLFTEPSESSNGPAN